MQPEARKALLFCNLDVRGGAPERADPMTVHEAQPILREGFTKYGLNIWVTDRSLQHLAA